MRILRRYLLVELASVFFGCLGILSLMLLCGNVMTKIADLIINWGVDFRLLSLFLLFSAPFLLSFTIPMSVLVAVLLTFGKLSSDHEITAMRASGVSLWKLVWPVLCVGVVLTLFLFYLNDALASRSHFRVREISSEIGMKQPASILEEGVFIKHFEGIILFIHTIRENELKGIRIYQPQEHGSTRTIVASRGELIAVPEKSVVRLKLSDGTIDEPDPQDPGKFYKLHFDSYVLPLDLSQHGMGKTISRKPKEMSIRELMEEFNRIKTESNFVAIDLLAEVHRKIAMSFSVIVFILIGIPLAIQTKRSEKSIGFAIAILLATMYWTLMMGATALAKMGIVHPALCLHVPNVAFAMLGVFLIHRTLKV